MRAGLPEVPNFRYEIAISALESCRFPKDLAVLAAYLQNLSWRHPCLFGRSLNVHSSVGATIVEPGVADVVGSAQAVMYSLQFQKLSSAEANG